MWEEDQPVVAFNGQDLLEEEHIPPGYDDVESEPPLYNRHAGEENPWHPVIGSQPVQYSPGFFPPDFLPPGLFPPGFVPPRDMYSEAYNRPAAPPPRMYPPGLEQRVYGGQSPSNGNDRVYFSWERQQWGGRE